MEVPTRGLYDLAITKPLYRVKVTDREWADELKFGAVTMVNVGAIPRPNGFPGGLAVVYEYVGKVKGKHAVRCFTATGNLTYIAQHYEKIHPYLRKNAAPFTADFKYLNPGILVKYTDSKTEAIYPLLVMEWIDGPDLIDYVDALALANDKAGLAKLVVDWRALLDSMNAAQIAHGDLSGKNIRVRKRDGALILLDYDDICFPGLEGQPRQTKGTAGFAHPIIMGKREPLFLEPRMDDFAALVILVALTALAADPSLWKRYTSRTADNKLLNETILFKSDDLDKPEASPLFAELGRLARAPELPPLLAALRAACKDPLGRVADPTLLFDADRDKKLALAVLETACASGDMAAIAEAWTPELKGYAPAQRFRIQAERAVQTMNALTELNAAMAPPNDLRIEELWRQYKTLLDVPELRLSTAFKKRIRQAEERVPYIRTFAALLEKKDERGVATYYEQNKAYLDDHITVNCKPEVLPAIDSTRKALEWQGLLCKAIAEGKYAEVAQLRSQRKSIPGWMGFTAEQTKFMADANALAEADKVVRAALKADALKADADEALAAANISYAVQIAKLALSKTQIDRLALATQRIAARDKLRKAAQRKSDVAIVAADDPLLAHPPLLLDSERVVLAEAHRRVAALKRVLAALAAPARDAVTIAAVVKVDSAAAKATRGCSEEEARLLALADDIAEAAKELADRLAARDDRGALLIYSNRISARGFSYGAAGLSKLLERQEAFKKLLKVNERKPVDDDVLVAAYSPTLSGSNLIDADLQRALHAAQARIAERTARAEARRLLIEALDRHDDIAIGELYKEKRLPAASELSTEQADAMAAALARALQFKALRTAIQTLPQNNAQPASRQQDAAIVAAYTELIRDHAQLTAPERKRIAQASARMQLVDGLAAARSASAVMEIVRRGENVGLRYALSEAENQRIARAQSCLEMVSKLAQEKTAASPHTAGPDADAQSDMRVESIYDDALAAEFEAPLGTELNAWVQSARQRRRELAALKEAIDAKRGDRAIAQRAALFPPSYAIGTASDTARVARARACVAAASKVEAARGSHDERIVAEHYAPVRALLANSDALTPEARAQAETALACTSMYSQLCAALEPAQTHTVGAARSDGALIGAYKAQLERPWMALTAQQRERIKLAVDRSAAFVTLTTLLEHSDNGCNDEQIVATMDGHATLLKDYDGITATQSKQVANARRRWTAVLALRAALRARDEREIVKVYTRDRIDLEAHPRIGEIERATITRAEECVKMPAAVRAALRLHQDLGLADVYNPELVREWMDFTSLEVAQIAAAQKRAVALRKFHALADANQDEELVVAYRASLGTLLIGSSDFTKKDGERFNLAEQRVAALGLLRTALRTNDDDMIWREYKPILLDECASLRPEERALVAQAKSRYRAREALRKGLQDSNAQVIVEAADALLAAGGEVTIPGWALADLAERVATARAAVAVNAALRIALSGGDEQQVVRADPGEAGILAGFFTPAEMKAIATARRAVAMPARVRAALARHDDEAVVAAYDEALERPFTLFSPDERDAIQSAFVRENARTRILAYAQAGKIEDLLGVERDTGVVVARKEVQELKHAYLQENEGSELKVELQGDELHAVWRWPATPHIEQAELVLRCEGPVTRRNEPDAHVFTAKRVAGAPYGKCVLTPPPHFEWYVRLYMALPSWIETNGAINWITSNGERPDCNVHTRQPVRVFWEVEKRRWSSTRRLLLRTEDGTPLPGLLLVARQAELPLRPEEGAPVVEIPPGNGNGHAEMALEINANLWPRNTYFRLFPTGDKPLRLAVSFSGPEGAGHRISIR